MHEIRLQKYIANCGIASRRKAEEMIEAGQVLVNGTVVTKLGTKVSPDKDRIQVGRRRIRPEKAGLIIFNKPLKVITSKKDEFGRKTVMDCLPNEFHSYFPVGRLDYDTTGLLVITNDGAMAEHLMHPRYAVDKIYIAKVKGKFSRLKIDQIKEGLELEDGLASAQVKILKRSERHSVLEIKISIGRNRIVRRIFDFLGHPVQTLKRIEQGPFLLGDLMPGEIKRFSDRAYLRMRTRLLSTVDNPSPSSDR